MKNIFSLYILAAIIALTGCTANKSLLKCPSLASLKKHHEIWAKARQHAADSKRAEKGNPFLEKNAATASIADDESPLSVKIPRIAAHKLSADDLQSANEVFAKYSGDKVKIERNEKGKYYLKANSAKDFIKLATALAAVRKTNPSAAPEVGGGVAIAAGILGIIAIVLALGPYVSYSAFVLGLLALILGIIGLGSPRTGWAITGIVLGALAIIFAGVIGIGLYVFVLHV